MQFTHTKAPLAATTLGLALSLILIATNAEAGSSRPGTSRAAPQQAGKVWVASGDVRGDGRSDRRASRAKQRRAEGKPQRARLEQTGTTVATAGDVQAPTGKPQRTKIKQNGTTVATADEVQAPNDKPQRARMEQNGTTVATAGNVAAPQHD
jgi:hypothetical protein